MEDLDLDKSARHATPVDMRTPRSYAGEVMQLHVEYSKKRSLFYVLAPNDAPTFLIFFHPQV